MIGFIRLVLVALVAMPQGWCCVVMDCGTCCVDSEIAASEQKTVSCPCCKQLDRDICQTDSRNNREERIPKSCDCHCRYLIADTQSPSKVVAAAVDSCFDEPFRIDSQCHSRPRFSNVPFFAFVRLQILQCSWQC